MPLVMSKCIEYLQDNSLSVMGIFRRTPSQFTVQEVKKKFNLGISNIISCMIIMLFQSSSFPKKIVSYDSTFFLFRSRS